MSVITEGQLRSAVRSFLIEKNFLGEDIEMTDELTKIIMRLGIGKDVNKSILAQAMKAGNERNHKENKVVSDLFMSILDKPDMLPKIIPLLKKAAAESEA